MNFEDMKVIWDSQEQEPLYAIDQKNLHSLIQSKTRKFRRHMRWQEVQTYGSTLLVLATAAFFLYLSYAGLLVKTDKDTTLSLWDQIALGVGSIFWIHFAYTVFSSRRKQAHQERVYTSTLSDEIDKDLSHVEFQIKIRKHIALRYVPPYFGALLFLYITIKMAGQSPWLALPVGAALAIALLIEARCQRRLVNKKMLPLKQDLEILKSKLAETENE
ncbi:hypothetical protein VDG1235_2166 [Verrucomicrobiia bacterium DG1235]|nr:hypothetical protein VDG1235_2166 [Verrucomicrobiae bacterium DG1235]